MYQNLKSIPIYSNKNSGFKPVDIIKYKNFEHHIIYSINSEESKNSINKFIEISKSNVILGFDTEWISWRRIESILKRKNSLSKQCSAYYATQCAIKIENYKEHLENVSNLGICTIQFGYENMSLVFCLSAIFSNDNKVVKRNISFSGKEFLSSNKIINLDDVKIPSIPVQIINLLNNSLTCFGGKLDLKVLQNNYPSLKFSCKMYDPIITLKKMGAEYTNLISMAKLFLNFDSSKERPDIDWINANYKRLVDAGEDAILSFLLRNYIEDPKNKDEIILKLKNFNIKKNNEIRRRKIKELKNPIIRKLILNLSDDEDNIDEKKYIHEFVSFLSTMKLQKMEIKYIENSTTEITTWQSTVSIELNFEKTISIADGLTRKEATKNAIKKLINDKSVFRTYLEIAHRTLCIDNKLSTSHIVHR